MKIREELRKRNPDSADYARDLSISYDRIGDIYKALGDTKSALTSYESSLKIAEELRKRNPDSADYARDLSISYDRMGIFIKHWAIKAPLRSKLFEDS
ncbi:MAG: tetratricopeptide repeat protein [Saprospiraceae bacterium]|nr:tetratricopeptide repeat protein [Saprospiraceae bacterium]